MIVRFFTLLVILPFLRIQCHVPCSQRYFPSGGDSFVCVCNSTYCDTVEPELNLNSIYEEYITSKDKYRLDKNTGFFDKHHERDSSLFYTIYRNKTYQTINGFGGAMTDATGYNLYSLSQDTQTNFIKSYFDSNGIEYNVIRVPVGGCDFSLREYTYSDEADDFNLTKFSLQMEDIKWKIPFIQTAKMLSKNEIKIFASAWTAPPWMKTNNDYKGNGSLIGPAGGTYYQTWANYFVKFFLSYGKFNISFWAMTAQNEPSDGEIYRFSFNCMGFSPEEQAIFVGENLGPALEANGFGNIKIMILDDQRVFLPLWPQRVLSYSKNALKYVSGIAVHWYMDSIIPPNLLDRTNDLFPDKFIFGTEACIGTKPEQHVILGSFVRAERYAKYIIQDLNHWVTGWTDWNMCLDLDGGPNWANNFVDSPIIVNPKQDEFYKQPMFYALGHFSKFIPVGSSRIGLTSLDSNKFISQVAFYDEKTRKNVFIMLNE